MLDLNSQLSQVISIAPVALTDGTEDGAAASLSDNHSAVVTFTSGVVTDGTHAVIVEESVDGTTFTTVADADLHFNGTDTTITDLDFAAADDGVSRSVGYKGSKGTIRASITTASSTTGAVMSAMIILGDEKQAGGSSIIS